MVIAFPGSSSFTAGNSYKPEIAVLAALLGGKSSIKWSTGFSLLAKAISSYPGAHVATSHASYSDAGLLTIQLSGSADAIRGASAEAVKALKGISEGSISKEDFTKAVALAKYRALEEGQNIEAGLVATGSGLVHGGKAFQISEISKSIEAVSADKLQAVSTSLGAKLDVTNHGYRLPKLFSTARQQFLQSVISLFFHSLRSLVLRFKVERQYLGGWACINRLQRAL